MAATRARQKGKSHALWDSSTSFWGAAIFHFPSLPQKPILHFGGTRGKMNADNHHSALYSELMIVGIREGSKGGQSPPLANDLACKV